MQYLSVKNFEKYQHYKHRNPRWIKLYYSLLDDADFLALPDAAQLSYFKLLLIASRTDNRITSEPSYLKRVTRSRKVLDLKPLFDAGFLVESEQGEIRGDSLSDSSLSLSLREHSASTPLAKGLHNASNTLAGRKQDASKMLAEIADKVFPPIP